MSRFCFVLLDLTTLIETSLDREKHGAFIRSGPVGSLRQCALMLLDTLDGNFPTADEASAGGTHEESYAAAVATLRRAGIEPRPDAAGYAEQRRQWEPLSPPRRADARHTMEEIDRRAASSMRTEAPGFA